MPLAILMKYMQGIPSVGGLFKEYYLYPSLYLVLIFLAGSCLVFSYVFFTTVDVLISVLLLLRPFITVRITPLNSETGMDWRLLVKDKSP